MADTVLPMAGKPFAKFGPLDVRIVPAQNIAKRDSLGGVARWLNRPVARFDPEDALFFFSLIDITLREEEEGRIRHQLNYDSMTGLPSRYNLISQVEKHLETNQTTRDRTPFVFVFFDLDRFENINDALGHRIGDQFRRRVSPVHGSFAENQIFARFGGDEFTVSPNIADLMRHPILFEDT